MPRINIKFNKGFLRDFPLKGGESYYFKKGNYNNQFPWTIQGHSPLYLSGYATAGFLSANIDSTHATTVDTKGTAMTVQSDNNAYVIGGTKIYRLLSDSTHLNYTNIVDNTPTTPTWPHAIASAVDTDKDMHDIIATQQVIGGGGLYNVLLYSYNVATGGGYLGRYDHTTASNWGAGNSSDTYGALSTNTIPDDNGSLSVPRPMCLGQNKMLYIGSGYVVDARDLSSASIDAPLVDLNVLDIDRDKEIQSLAFWGNKLVIAARDKRGTIGGDYADAKGKVVVYFWDTFSPSYDDAIVLDDDECGALFVSGDDLYLFTANAVYGNLRQWNDSEFVSIQQVNKQIPLHGSVDELRNGIIWGDTTGKLWWFGEAVIDEGKWVWNIGKVGTNISCVKRLASTGEKLHIAGSETAVATGYIRSLTTTFAEAEILIPVTDLPTRSTITRIELRFLPLETGSSLLMSCHPNNQYSSEYDIGVSYAIDGEVTRKISKQRIKDVSFLTIGLFWGTATKTVRLESILIDYEVPKSKQ